ncbi:MAG: hypothetical protein JWQ44_2846 [Chthoniobacter sp.]|nr:hypothetical protein [Chthoniobacter sp.]
MKRSLAGLLSLSLAAVAAAQSLPADGFFSDGVTSHPAPPNFTPQPILDNTAAASVSATLSASQATGVPLAVRVRQGLDDASAISVFNNFPVNYVFTDFIGANAGLRAGEVADLVVGSPQSRNAFVGNFDLYPNSDQDTTRPAAATPNPSSNYTDARGLLRFAKQIAAPSLRPGGPDYRNPASGNSNAPNIRAALFVLPIQRLTLAELGLRGIGRVPTGETSFTITEAPADPTQRLIPWVSRFNAFGNSALDTDGNPGNGFAFVQNAATPANGQLPSRGDFQVQILHYRLRGSASVNLNSGGGSNVIGYSPAQEQADVRLGWSASTLANEIFARGGAAVACLSNSIGDQGGETGNTVARSTEVAGAVWSGVYDRHGTIDPATGTRRLLIALSNLGSAAKTIDFPVVGGVSLFDSTDAGQEDDRDNFTIAPGQHRLLEFSLELSSRGRTEWVFKNSQFIGLDNNRNGVGTGNAFPATQTPVTIAAEVCPGSGGNAASIASAGAGATYHWHVIGGEVQTGQGTNAITFAAGDGPSATVSVTVLNSAGAVVQGSAIVGVGPPTSISAPPSALANSTGHGAEGPPGAGLTYQWSIDGDGAAIIGSSTGRTITFAMGSEDLTLLLTVTNAQGCHGSSVAVVKFNDAPQIRDDQVFLIGNQPREILVLNNDGAFSKDRLRVESVTQPQFGTVTILGDGTLIRYTPHGSVRPDSFTYTIRDAEGGTATATVTVGDFFATVAGELTGLVQAFAGSGDSEHFGLLRLKVARTGAFTGALQLAGRKFALRGYFDLSGVAHFLKPALTELTLKRASPDLPDLKLRLTLAEDLLSVTGTLAESGNTISTLNADRALFTSKPNPPPPLIAMPAGLAGKYTVIFPPRTNALPPGAFPQGTGIGQLTVSSKGIAVLKGTLADGTPVSCAGPLSKTQTWPFHVAFAKGAGSISGPVKFRDIPNVSDLDGRDLNWFKPAGGTTYYPDGWPDGITVDLLGSRFSKPSDGSAFTGVAAEDDDGNAAATLNGDGLAPALVKSLNVSAKNQITVLPPNDEALSLKLAPTGAVSGSFLHPVDQTKTALRATVFQKQNRALGFFLGADESGGVMIAPK